ncbi:MAG: YigZ family protein [Xanthomonadaceae bacterium]|nr:YigZ family protein [Xanthomonadaceae bacterium]MDE2246778.1 YigZ family protein [Xanthomonadaceae bacterium]
MPTATLAAPARFEQRVRHSRFLAVATSVDAAAAATAWIAAQSDAAASHHCWAYRIGDAYRFSDDGEPAGTAGRPILQAIDGQGLDHVAVLVSRWFGGIKLGAGGLVRAYGGTAAECLRTAPRRPLHKLITANVQAAPAALARLRGRLAQFEATLELAAIADTTLTLRLPAEQLPALERWLADQTRGQGRCRAT